MIKHFSFFYLRLSLVTLPVSNEDKQLSLEQLGVRFILSAILLVTGAQKRFENVY